MAFPKRKRIVAADFIASVIEPCVGSVSSALVDELCFAFSSVPRHEFVDPSLRLRAYEDLSLPIGHGQTISRPSTVAVMLANLDLKPKQRVLEVGAGCGYVTAVLSALGCSVFAVERVGPLGQAARGRLDRLGFHNILLRTGNGLKGWGEYAPFDRILVSAAVSVIPRALLVQLAAGGKLLAPVVQSDDSQRLELWERGEDNKLFFSDLGPCSFVRAFEDR